MKSCPAVTNLRAVTCPGLRLLDSLELTYCSAVTNKLINEMESE